MEATPFFVAAFRVLVDQSSCAMAVLDLRGHFLHVNAAFAGLFGESTSPEDFPDVELASLLSEEGARELRTSVLSIAAGEGWEGSLRLWRKDRNAELRVRLSPVRPDTTDGEAEALVAEFVPKRHTLTPTSEPVLEAPNDGVIPILPIAPRVIVVPVVGVLDALRSTLLMRLVLAGITAHRAKAVIIDVTGLSEVDARSADYLARTVLAARLKGAKTVVSGLSEQASEALTEIDVEWNEIATVGNLQTALTAALGHIGLSLLSTGPRSARGGR